MTALDLLRLRRSDVIQLAAEHGAHNVRVFGSVVRGEATRDSDIDFIVDMEPGRSLLDLVALSDRLEELLGRRVDLLTTRSIHRYLRDRISKEAQLL
jgi:predicted nucleotidyltransferase